MLALLLLGRALAGVPEDVAMAADHDQPLALRQAALTRVVSSNDTQAIVKIVDLRDTSRNERWVAVRALGKMTDDAARAALLRYVDAADSGTRMAALGGLGDRGDLTLSGRVAMHLEDKALLVRAAACDALTHLKDPNTLPDLGRALADPSNTYRGTSLWLRRRYVEAIGIIGTNAAIPYLAKALDDTDPDVVKASREALEKVAGFSYAEGRTPAEELAAWKRWAAAH